MIGHLNSGTTLSASRIDNDTGIPQISPFATHPRFTRQESAGVFRMAADDVQLGNALGLYAVRSLQASRVAVIDDRLVPPRSFVRHACKLVCLEWSIPTADIARPTPKVDRAQNRHRSCV